MKLAVTVWGNRISPVLDSAKTILIAEVRESRIVDQSFNEFEFNHPLRGLAMLENDQVDVLICGAVTKQETRTIEKYGIVPVPFITGSVQKVLGAYLTEKKRLSDFLMPGASR